MDNILDPDSHTDNILDLVRMKADVVVMVLVKGANDVIEEHSKFSI
jgi:hypothetical protein